MAILVVLVVAVQTPLLELAMAALEHLGKETLAALALAALTGLVVVAAALLRLVQITQPYKQAVLAVLVQRFLRLWAAAHMLVVVVVVEVLLLVVLVVLVAVAQELSKVAVLVWRGLQTLAAVAVAHEMTMAVQAALAL
jgi:hypothetical protein